LSLREKIEAEQSGAPPVLSVRFEKAVSLAASLVTKLNQTGISCCMVIHGDGREPQTFISANTALRQLADIAPFKFSSEPSTNGLRILDDLRGRQVYLLTARPDHWGSEFTAGFEIIPY
jgi:hypothetical protein